MVSSVTYMTGRPCFTAKVTASSDTRTILSRVQSSAYCRMLDEPMKVAASIGTPTSSDTRTIGSTSAMTVRAAQFMLMGSFWSTISRARARTCATARAPAPGRPMSAARTPRSAMRWRRRILTSIGGSMTDGLCSPSRSVSSLSTTGARA